MPKTRRPLDSRLKNQVMTLDFSTAPTIDRFIDLIRNNDKPEICCFGTRGDGKTIGALTGMICHAESHQQSGYSLPVNWMGVSDTFTSHKLKTVRTMENPIWCGGWQLFDQDHVAVFRKAGAPLVKIDLFGIEDQGAMDRLRMETVGMWFEEPAPSSVMVQSSGISESAWLLGRTSQRMPSHFHPAIITSNYPDEDHWTWRRFVVNQAEGTCYLRVPPGERASKEQREEWARALKDRPDLLRRLLEGQPGVISLGQPVATGFDYDHHVATERLIPVRGEPMAIGFDFGHTPTAVIGQDLRGRLRCYVSLTMENAGMRQLLDEQVVPWLARYTPWVLKSGEILVGYDPSGDVGTDEDIEKSPLRAIEEALGSAWCEPGPVRWPNRKGALLQLLARHGGLLLDPVGCEGLVKALNGRWYNAKTHQGELRSDMPKKPNHPWEDYGDALIYLICRLGVGGQISPIRTEYKVERNITWLP